MIRAMRDGRKTQTRRIVKPQPQNDPACHHPISAYRTSTGDWSWVLSATGHGTGDPFLCPYGHPGDMLWVRESWAPTGVETACYRADCPIDDALRKSGHANRTAHTWRPSIHMPRKASRLTLRITNIRVERLQDISRNDAIAEGLLWVKDGGTPWGVPGITSTWNSDPRECYRALWAEINGAESWAANPWCWALTFDVLQANVDQVMRKAA